MKKKEKTITLIDKILKFFSISQNELTSNIPAQHKYISAITIPIKKILTNQVTPIQLNLYQAMLKKYYQLET